MKMIDCVFGPNQGLLRTMAPIKKGGRPKDQLIAYLEKISKQTGLGQKVRELQLDVIAQFIMDYNLTFEDVYDILKTYLKKGETEKIQEIIGLSGSKPL